MTVNIENFIGVFDGFYCNEFCESVISFFDQMEKEGFVKNRKQEEGDEINKFVKDDSLIFTHLFTKYPTYHSPFHGAFLNTIWREIYPLYCEKYDILPNLGRHEVYSNKIQKTEIGQGYHVWHTESYDENTARRLLVYTLYLNDVDEGGETEFLYYPRRVKPVKGRILLFPASFTHTHRGNPPISNTKYIITGWIEY